MDNNLFNDDNKKEEKRRQGGFFKRAFPVILAFVLGIGLFSAGLGIGKSIYKEIPNEDIVELPKSIEEAEEKENKIKETNSVKTTLDTASISTATDEEKKLVDVIEQSSKSVVSINLMTTVRSAFYGQLLAPSAGSGVIFHEDQDKIYIATNNHVVQNSQDITVSLDDTNQISAEILGRDPQSDIAVITIDRKEAEAMEGFDYKVAVFGDSDSLQVGRTAIAIGNAAGEGKSATVGIVSALDRQINTGDSTLDVIQTDAAINPGNSGGALINLSGEVIGINTAKLSENDIEGMGYAIPSNTVRALAEELVNTGTVQRPFLGITGFTVTEQMKEQYSLPSLGVAIQGVTRYSGADIAGLSSGDIITSFDGNEIKTIEELLGFIDKTEVGDLVELNVYRDSKEYTVKVEIMNANDTIN